MSVFRAAGASQGRGEKRSTKEEQLRRGMIKEKFQVPGFHTNIQLFIYSHVKMTRNMATGEPGSFSRAILIFAQLQQLVKIVTKQ
jgi:hypothetical protein